MLGCWKYLKVSSSSSFGSRMIYDVCLPSDQNMDQGLKPPKAIDLCTFSINCGNCKSFTQFLVYVELHQYKKNMKLLEVKVLIDMVGWQLMGIDKVLVNRKTETPSLAPEEVNIEAQEAQELSCDIGWKRMGLVLLGEIKLYKLVMNECVKQKFVERERTATTCIPKYATPIIFSADFRKKARP
ncbi:hypothetical protein RHGRI_005174 [Rhododendron griersonianum]|uniref:Uncharacterized protein n=1 Tax=Rhododendron griersonianum TaxID=479676 RepID=A0AAV6LD61_9ERIC|nr:hypothetical protein RHGRI_005174 [Rhododendron griersonianum]